MEAGLVGRPIDRGSGAEERTLEALCAVMNLRSRNDTAPLHVKRNGRPHGGGGCDERIWVVRIAGQSQPLGHRVGNVVVIEDLQPIHLQARSPSVEVDLDGVLPHWDHPEHVVRVDVYVVIVDLFGEISRSGRTGIQVESNEGESALMRTAVCADELALTEAHVGLEPQRSCRTRDGVRAGPTAANVR